MRLLYLLPKSLLPAICAGRRLICGIRKKRSALQEIDLNISPPLAQQRATSISQAPFRLATINHSPIPVVVVVPVVDVVDVVDVWLGLVVWLVSFPARIYYF
jgi:hypothetical protein